MAPEDLKGGTITVSNIGSIGGTVVAPVLVDSEVAILGVSKARRVPVFNEKDEVVAALMMKGVYVSFCIAEGVLRTVRRAESASKVISSLYRK